MDDPFDLERFVVAQDGVIDKALGELRSGRKRSHWMWFVFPQIAGLGHSAMAVRYAIAGLDEARSYLAHPVLGPRLATATAAVLAQSEDDPVALMGEIDAAKLRSSMTLFAAAGGGEDFRRVLDRFFAGQDDPATLARLRED